MTHGYASLDEYREVLGRNPQLTDSPEVAALRAYARDEVAAGRIDSATGARIAELLDDISARDIPLEGDLVGPNATTVHPYVLEVVDDQGTHWRRAFGTDRYDRDEETGDIRTSQDYDWITTGGLCTTEGVLEYTPLRVTRVLTRPARKE